MAYKACAGNLGMTIQCSDTLHRPVWQSTSLENWPRKEFPNVMFVKAPC